MINRLLIPGLLMLAPQAFSQNFTLTGKAVSYLDGKATRLYYTTDSRQFSKSRFITLSSNHAYVFKMPLADLKKNAVSKLYFSADSAADQSSENACTYQVNVEYILKSPLYANAKSIDLKTDIFYDMYCAAMMFRGADTESEQKFLGQYKMQVGNVSYSITAESGFYWITAVSSNKSMSLLDEEETGEWNFDAAGRLFTIKLKAVQNTAAGLRTDEDKRYSFTVAEVDGKLVFSNPSVKGVVLEKVY